MTGEQGPWIDDDHQQVRPYAVTAGRTRPSREMDLASLVKVRATLPRAALGPEHAMLLEWCRGGPCSVAEIAGRMRQPVQVVKVLLSDMIDSGLLIMAMPDTSDSANRQILEQLLAGLRAM